MFDRVWNWLKNSEPVRYYRRVTLKPYSNELLTRGGDFWIFCARTIIILMASAEALSWGYMGSLISQTASVLTAGVAAVFVFSIVWIVDATFMTLDFSQSLYERVLTGKKVAKWKDDLRVVSGVGLRLVIVAGTMLVAAPFLTQAVFSRDVSQHIEQYNATQTASKRSKIQQTYVDALARLDSSKATLERQRVMEAAGKGLSGRYGRGPAVQTIELQLQAMEQEIADKEGQMTQALAEYDSASTGDKQKAYGVELLAPGIQTSGRVLKELLSNPAYTKADWAVKAFLAFLFLGMFIIKLFQPRSIAVYYSERLHSLYDQYKRKEFDGFLPEAERACSGADMDPLRFEDWCLNTYAVVRDEDKRRRDSERVFNKYRTRLTDISRLLAEERGELEPVVARYSQLLPECQALEKKLHDARAECEAKSAEHDELGMEYEALKSQVEEGKLQSDVVKHALKRISELAARKPALQRVKAGLQGEIETVDKMIQPRRKEIESLRKEIDDKQAAIAEVQKQMDDVRGKFLEYLGEGGE